MRVAQPLGNKQQGRFQKSEDLTRGYQRKVKLYFQAEEDALTGRVRAKVAPGEDFEGRKPVLYGYEFRSRKLKATIKGRDYEARVLKDGMISFRGKRYTSPSAVATVITRRPMNGWHFWKIERMPGEWVLLDWLRKTR
jgi:hypothetical protein